MSALPVPPASGARDGRAPLRVRYLHADADVPLSDPQVLAVLRFGAAPAAHDGGDARLLQVGLQALEGPAPLEVWYGSGPVRCATHEGIVHCSDGHRAFVAVAVEERGDVRAAAREAYARIAGCLSSTGYPHALRIWNYLDAITEGEGDQERYRQFCVGRAEGMGGAWAPFPAATAIGRCAIPGGAARRLQVYALASREPGTAIENPRQVSAYRYPRQYGPQPPSFARAMLPASGAPLLLSGTASVVGHASAHPGSLPAQLAETCVNLERLLARARELSPALAAAYGASSLLKVYLRDAACAAEVRAALAERMPGAALLLLHAEVCRRELLVEIDGFHA